MSYNKLLSFIADAALVLWFYRPIRPAAAVPLRRRAAGLLPFMAMLPIYLFALEYTGLLADTLLRFAVRVAVYALYVYFAKQRSAACSLYLGVLAWLACTAVNCMYLTPLFFDLRGGESLAAQLAEIFFTACVLTLVSRLINMNEITLSDTARVPFAAVLTVVQLYVKASLAQLSAAPDNWRSGSSVLTSYPLILQTLLLCAVIFFERYMYSQYLRESARLSEVANRYRYEYAQASASAAASLRQMHHDMKNHLLAIQRLSGSSASDASQYIQSLLKDFNAYENLVHTGSDLLDGLLSEKIRLARAQQTAIAVNVDFTAGGFIQPKDVCALFGNALDNALEASAQVTAPDRRSILVKGGVAADSLVLLFTNYYEGELVQVGPRLLSRKQEAGHGIGITSINRVVSRYGGTAAYRTDELHNFVLTVRIPLPRQA